MLKPLKIAFIRLSSMGDIIHSASILPSLFSALSEKYQPIFDWYVDSIFYEILEQSPYIHKLIALPIKQSLQERKPKNLLKIYQSLKEESYDYVIDLQGLIKSALIGKCLTTQHFIGFDYQSIKEPLASFFYTQKVSIPYEKHILLRNATLAFSAFNLTIPTLQTLLHPPTFLASNSNLSPLLIEGKKVLLVLETSKPNKTYPQSSFLELVRLFNIVGIKPLLLSHKQAIKNANKTLEFQTLSHLNLGQIKAILSQMDLIIGGDTGITHLSWAFNRPSITLFGATPAQRFGLNTDKNLSLSGNPHPNYDKKDYSITLIPPQEIFNQAKNLLGISQ